uniref:Putative ovule protein n=1 Tax=Solanum chacoense TaxID=4108 RepID=A0A0V0H968_SOLCH
MNAPSSSTMMPFNMNPMSGMSTVVPHGGQLMIRDPQQQQQLLQQPIQVQQFITALAAKEQRDQQEMLKFYEQQEQQASQQEDVVRFNGGFDSTGSVTATGFHQMSSSVPPSLVLAGTYENPYNLVPPHQQSQPEHSLSYQQQVHLQSQQQLQPPQPPETPRQQQRANSEEEGRGSGGPSG